MDTGVRRWGLFWPFPCDSLRAWRDFGEKVGYWSIASGGVYPLEWFFCKDLQDSSRWQHKMKTSRLFIVILAFVLFAGCAGSREWKQVCSGLLQTGLHAESFLQVWGNPTRTKVISGDEIMRAGWGGGGGGFYKGKAHFQVWSYEDHGVDLVFTTGKKSTLVGWNTKKTLQELSTIAPNRCKAQEQGQP